MLLLFQTLKKPKTFLIPLVTALLLCFPFVKFFKKSFDLLCSVHFNPYIHTLNTPIWLHSHYAISGHSLIIVELDVSSKFNRVEHFLLHDILSLMSGHHIFGGFLLLNFLFFLSLLCWLFFFFLITRPFFLTVEILQDSVFSFLFFPSTFTHRLGHLNQSYVFKYQVFLFSISVTFNSTILSD